MPIPSWLPALFSVNPWDHTTYDSLYKIFHNDFIANKAYYCKIPVGFDRNKENGKEKTFWHVTTRDDKHNSERLPDLRRSERLPWLKPILENSTKPEILAWEYTEGDGAINIYVWLKDHDYLAIMKKTKKGGQILLTAYWIEYGNVKKKCIYSA
jgi:hypothetical protein